MLSNNQTRPVFSTTRRLHCNVISTDYTVVLEDEEQNDERVI